MHDKMAISAYILEESRKGPMFKASNQSLGYFQLMSFRDSIWKIPALKI